MLPYAYRTDLLRSDGSHETLRCDHHHYTAITMNSAALSNLESTPFSIRK